MPRPKPLDLLIIGAVALLALLMIYFFGPGDTGATAVILIDGREAASYPLSGPVQEIEIGPCRFRIGDGKAQFLSSDCPDQICVHMGTLTHAGQSAACLPRRVLLEIRGKGGVDVIAG